MKKDRKDRMDRKEFDASYKLADITRDILHGKEINNDEFVDLLSANSKSDKFINDLLSEEYIKNSFDIIDKGYEERETEKLLNIIKQKRKTRRLKSSVLIPAAISITAAVLVLFNINLGKEQSKVYIANKAATVDNYSKPVIIEGDKTFNVYGLKSDNKDSLNIDYNGEKLNYFSKAKSNRGDSYIAEIKNHKIIVPAGFTQTIVLADGSEVIINSQSSLSYPIKFTGERREVILEGEAYFKIAKEEKPFIVKVRGLETRVYGTEFNINEFNNKVEAVLISGEIGVSAVDYKNTIDDKKEVRLQPNQMFISDINMNNPEVREVDVKEYTNWMKKNFDYRNHSLSDLLRDMARWYDIEFEIATDIDNYTISLYASRDAPSKDLFELINMSNDLIFVNQGGGRYKIEK